MKKNFALVRFEDVRDELGNDRTRQVLAVCLEAESLKDYCMKEHGVPVVPISALGLPVRNTKDYLKDNYYYAIEETDIKILISIPIL